MASPAPTPASAPGLGIDVQEQNSTPESVRDCVQAIFKAGGSGLVLSTSHAAMRPENLSAVGATLRELKDQPSPTPSTNPTRTRSTFRSVDSSTSIRSPPSSTTSPTSGMCPAISDTNPPIVVAS
jgi:hypothetical protein